MEVCCVCDRGEWKIDRAWRKLEGVSCRMFLWNIFKGEVLENSLQENPDRGYLSFIYVLFFVCH